MNTMLLRLLLSLLGGNINLIKFGFIHIGHKDFFYHFLKIEVSFFQGICPGKCLGWVLTFFALKCSQTFFPKKRNLWIIHWPFPATYFLTNVWLGLYDCFWKIKPQPINKLLVLVILQKSAYQVVVYFPGISEIFLKVK